MLAGSSSGGIRQRSSRNGVSVTRASQNSPEAAAWDSRPGVGSPGEGHIRAEEGGNTHYTKSVSCLVQLQKRKRLTPGTVRIAETFLSGSRMLDGAKIFADRS